MAKRRLPELARELVVVVKSDFGELGVALQNRDDFQPGGEDAVARAREVGEGRIVYRHRVECSRLDDQVTLPDELVDQRRPWNEIALCRRCHEQHDGQGCEQEASLHELSSLGAHHTRRWCFLWGLTKKNNGRVRGFLGLDRDGIFSTEDRGNESTRSRSFVGRVAWLRLLGQEQARPSPGV